jgi:hypothetical protein
MRRYEKEHDPSHWLPSGDGHGQLMDIALEFMFLFIAHRAFFT